MNEPRRLFVKSFGCQMNVYDSRRMADTLAPQGYVETSAPDDADLVILNTCHIREKAAEKVYSELGRVRRLKEAAAAATARARRARGQSGRYRISSRRQVRSSRRAECGDDSRARRFRFRHRAGRLRQVLYVLRRALHPRLGSVAARAQER